MNLNHIFLFGVLALAIVSGDVLAQDPTAGLQKAGEESLTWLLDVASVIGAVAIVVVGLFNYAGAISREWMIRVIVISAVIIVGPQIIKFIFEVGRTV